MSGNIFENFFSPAFPPFPRYAGFTPFLIAIHKLALCTRVQHCLDACWKTLKKSLCDSFRYF